MGWEDVDYWGHDFSWMRFFSPPPWWLGGGALEDIFSVEFSIGRGRLVRMEGGCFLHWVGTEERAYLRSAREKAYKNMTRQFCSCREYGPSSERTGELQR